MAKPIILTVDDEEQVRSAVERDLARHYRKDYRILKASSGAEALETVHRLKQRSDAIALFLVDQRMPQMSGVEMLEKAVKVFPDAKRALLTAYADTDAAIKAIKKWKYKPKIVNGRPVRRTGVRVRLSFDLNG